MKGSGTETEALHDAMQEEMTTRDRLGETETSLMIEEVVVVADVEIGPTVKADSEAENKSAGEAQVRRLRRRSRLQT